MALFRAAIRRDLVSFLIYPFLRRVQVFLCKISSVCHLEYLIIIIIMIIIIIISIIVAAAIIDTLRVFFSL